MSPHGKGERLTVLSISRVVHTIATPKGLGHIHPHSLRHGGQHTFDHDGFLPAIQQLMGHSRLTTTAGFYVDGSVPRIMREIRKAHPHAGWKCSAGGYRRRRQLSEELTIGLEAEGGSVMRKFPP